MARCIGKPLHRWPAERWCDYFQRQKQTLLAIPWDRGPEITPEERDVIGRSLQQFQQGEANEGAHFYRCVRAYGEEHGELKYVEAHRLFMAEEQRHGQTLGSFLALVDVPRLTQQCWLNKAFCWLGSRGGLEPTLVIILMAEIMAQAYYTALRGATRSLVLRRMCDQILRDEKSHVRFQAERLAYLRRHRGGLGLMMRHTLDLALFMGTGLACWLGHRRVLNASGYGFRRFWSLAWERMRAASRIKDPRNHLWGDES